ncbi:MAG: helix-turn-helix domain-containing protein [Pseudomonadota bacterium]
MSGPNPAPSTRLVPSGGVIHLVRALQDEGVDFGPIRQMLGGDFSTLTTQNTRIQAAKIPLAYAMAMELPVREDFWLRLGSGFSVHNWHLELSNWILTGRNFADIMPKLHGIYGVEAEGVNSMTPRPPQDEGREYPWIRQALTPVPGDAPSFCAHAELAAATLVSGLKSLLGKENLEFRFTFAYAEPVYSDCYRDVLGTQLLFDAESTEFHVPADYFYREFLSSDAVMHQYFEQQLEEFFPPEVDSQDIVARVENVLRDYHGNFPSLPQVSAMLALGERSLRRNLAACGTSYRELLLRTKMHRALYYLEHTDISVEEIAYRLDYSDYANFRRAFLAQQGESPSHYRSSARDSSARVSSARVSSARASFVRESPARESSARESAGAEIVKS